MAYRARWLARNHACQEWGNLLFWDTETLGKAIPGETTTKLHKLRLGVARSLRREKGKATRRDRLKYTTNEEFWQWLYLRMDKKRPLYCFAHNVGFDLTISRFWDKIGSGELVLSRKEPVKNPKDGGAETRTWRGCFCDSDPPTIIGVKHAESGCKITFVDSLNYYRHSLRKIGDKLGIPKLPMPLFEASDEDWFVYCEQDVIVLEQAMLQLMDWFADNKYGNFKYTQASLAMAAFRHRFYKHPLILDSSPAYDSLEKESYYGGRLEMFRKGKVRGLVYELDVNSQYPSVMHKNLFPVERVAHSGTSPLRVEVDDLDIQFIAKVKVKTDVSRYPVRELRRGTFYPTGEFWTVLAGPELVAAKQRGNILELDGWAKYRLAPLFRDFVTHFWERRLEAKERGDETEDYFLKILMNSLYGKFAQQTPEWVDLDDRNELPLWIQSWLTEDEYNRDIAAHNDMAPKFFLWSSSDSRDRIKYRTIGKHAQISTERKPHCNSFCAVASYVTSYARKMIDDAIEIAGRENVCYVVTDAVFVRHAGYARIQRAGLIRPRELGYFSVEAEGRNARFDALHHWQLDTERRNGSRKRESSVICPHCYVPVDDDARVCPKCQKRWDELNTIENQFEGIRGVLSRSDKEGIRIGQVVKEWSRSYSRGNVDSGGIITPLQYAVGVEGNYCLSDLEAEFVGV